MGQIGYSSGFAFQSSFGTWQNRELFIPWPSGGIAHFWYDSKWNGPAIIGSDKVTSLAVWESHHQSVSNGDHGNFELMAVVGNKLVHWWRENGDGFQWHRGVELPLVTSADSSRKASVTFGHTPLFDPKKYPVKFYAIVTEPEQGLRVFSRNPETLQWNNGERMTQLPANATEMGSLEEPITGHYTGLGWALGTVGDTNTEFEHMTIGRAAFVATREDGTLICHDDENQMYIAGSQGLPNATINFTRRWHKGQVVGAGAKGRPCILQTDRGYRGAILFIVAWFSPPRHGNYELFAPAVDGGVLHFWRDNNEGDKFWRSAGKIGHEHYDEVSAFQDVNETEGDETARIHLFAWRRGEKWVHHFEQLHRADGFHWRGPFTIGERDPSHLMDPMPWIITCVDSGTFQGRRKWVKQVGGIRDGQRWRMTKEEVIREIRAGRKRFETMSPDGRKARVRVVDYIDPDKGIFHPYLTTEMDEIAGNNLLNLPSCSV